MTLKHQSHITNFSLIIFQGKDHISSELGKNEDDKLKNQSAIKIIHSKKKKKKKKKPISRPQPGSENLARGEISSPAPTPRSSFSRLGSASRRLADWFVNGVKISGQLVPDKYLPRRSGSTSRRSYRDPCASDRDRDGTSSDLVSERERMNLAGITKPPPSGHRCIWFV
ncbi:hypothetical protein L484_015238 [Morus notabilis]|uniref:Uncharacterized protein n=1 Tax=Morus notabilis TaxID=981085 RepID=W9SJ45_9ROSA|nr:hypothetical protein L484_015238 [Morus notabilis]